jgi:hypothetical protein
MRRVEQRLGESVAALGDAGIEVILLKGAALAATAYESFPARPMKDVDILVEAARASEAREIMCRTGWVNGSAARSDEVYEAHHHVRPVYDGRDRSIRLEIHSALTPPGSPFAHSFAQLRAAARPVNVGSSRAFVLEPNTHAVYSSIHFAWSHEMLVGAWHAFRDINVLLQRGFIDWNRLVHVAAQWRARTCCYWTLRLAVALAGVRVPDAVLATLRPRLSRLMERRLARHFTDQVLQTDSACPSVSLGRALWGLAMQPARHDHGEARPWLAPSELMIARSPAATRVRGRLFEHAANARRWTRFLTSIAWRTEAEF